MIKVNEKLQGKTRSVIYILSVLLLCDSRFIQQVYDKSLYCNIDICTMIHIYHDPII